MLEYSRSNGFTLGCGAPIPGYPERAMNIFGAVTFGSLIKTFLPGLVWLCAFAIVEADIALYCGYESYVVKILGNKE
jgi:hypothetical protein